MTSNLTKKITMTVSTPKATSAETAVVAVLSFDGVICMHYQTAPHTEAKIAGEPARCPNAPVCLCVKD